MVCWQHCCSNHCLAMSGDVSQCRATLADVRRRRRLQSRDRSVAPLSCRHHHVGCATSPDVGRCGAMSVDVDRCQGATRDPTLTPTLPLLATSPRHRPMSDSTAGDPGWLLATSPPTSPDVESLAERHHIPASNIAYDIARRRFSSKAMSSDHWKHRLRHRPMFACTSPRR